jgi:hypothetical protein
MRDSDIDDYLHRHRPAIDMTMATLGAIGFVAAVLGAIRHDRIRRPPRRRLARRHG